MTETLEQRAGKLAERAFVAAVVMLPLQWLPPIPLAGAQLSDFAFLIAAIALLVARPRPGDLHRVDMCWLGLFAGGATASALVNGGSYVKLAGHLELVVVAACAALLARDAATMARIRQALIWAAVLAAITGLMGAVLFFFGHWTGLLNHYGDLVPGDYPRIRGTCIRTNMLATVLATGFILLLGEKRESMLGRLRWPIAAVILLALFFTFSRTWMTLAAGIAMVLALNLGGCGRIAGAAIASAIVAVLLLLSARYAVELEPTHFWEVTVSSDPGTRWVIWGDTLDTIAAHPIFGAGPGSPATAIGWSAHLVWLNLWAVLGLVPLFAFAAGAGRALSRYRVDHYLAAAVGVIILDGLARDVEDQRHLWVMIGLLASAASASGGRGSQLRE